MKAKHAYKFFEALAERNTVEKQFIIARQETAKNLKRAEENLALLDERMRDNCKHEDCSGLSCNDCGADFS